MHPFVIVKRPSLALLVLLLLAGPADHRCAPFFTPHNLHCIRPLVLLLLLLQDLPISAVQAMDVMDAMAAPGAEPDTLGWLQDLLGQDDMPVPAPASAPAAPAPAVVAASPVMSASMHGSMSGHGFGGQWASGNGSEVHTGAWSGASAGSQQPSALDHDLQGTAHYAAPEDLVVGGNGYALGPKADVFSLGYCIW